MPTRNPDSPGAGIARRIAGLALLVLAATPAMAQELAEYRVEFPAGQSAQRPVAPGASTTLEFTVRNTGATTGIAVVGGSMGYDVTSLAGYVFVADEPARCPAPAVVQDFGYYVRFRVGPLAPGESLACRYQVSRAADSRNDLGFELCGRSASYQPCNTPHWFGTLPALTLRVDPAEPVAYGARSVLVRVTATNPTARAIARRIAATGCWEFGGGMFGPPPFEIVSGFPGSCAPRNDLDQCANFTGQNFSSQELELGAIPANGTASCLLRLDFAQPLIAPTFIDLNFYGNAVAFADGGIGLDPAAALVSAPLGAAPPSQVPLGRPGLGIAAVLMALAALRALRRRGSDARPC